MIERHITYTVNEGKASEFERFITDRYGPQMALAPGFVRIELLREAENDTRYQMSFRFEDLAASAGWRNSPEHAALQPELNALVGSPEIQGYDVVR